MAHLTLMEWIAERADNCERIGATKTGADRASWAEDERYFTAVLNALATLQTIEGRVRRVSDSDAS